MRRQAINGTAVLAFFWALNILSLIVASSGFAQSVTRIPQFRDYAAGQIFQGTPARVDVSVPENAKYRTRLRDAATKPANFAGHYVLTTWGCGTSCETGAAVNLKTGAVIFLPATTCCWGDVDGNFKAVEFRVQSRLIVLSGQLNEQGPKGAHFFELTDGVFKPVVSIPSTTPSSSPIPTPMGNASPAVRVSPAPLLDENESRATNLLQLFDGLLGLREAVAASDNAWPDDYRDILLTIQSTSKFSTPEQTKQALSFLLRGAITLPIQSTMRASSFILYNPAVDVGMVLTFPAAAAAAPKSGALLPGEMLRGQPVRDVKPSWMLGGEWANTTVRLTQQVRKSNSNYGSATSSLDPSADYSTLLRLSPQHAAVARHRIFIAALVAANKEIDCGRYIDELAKSVETIRAALGEQFKIKVASGARTATYPIGGGVDVNRAVKIYALRDNPFVEISVWFDPQACKPLEAVPVEVLTPEP